MGGKHGKCDKVPRATANSYMNMCVSSLRRGHAADNRRPASEIEIFVTSRVPFGQKTTLLGHQIMMHLNYSNDHPFFMNIND